MTIPKRINLVVLILLGIMAGLTKILLVAEEQAFLAGVGFSDSGIILFGITQLAGGVLLIFPGTRLGGAVLLALTLAVSTVTIFLSGKTGFGFFSIVPILMTGVVLWDGLVPRNSEVGNA